MVIDPVVAVHRSAVSARVEVSGYAPIVVPGLRLLLRAVSAGPLERLGAPGEPP